MGTKNPVLSPLTIQLSQDSQTFDPYTDGREHNREGARMCVRFVLFENLMVACLAWRGFAFEFRNNS